MDRYPATYTHSELCAAEQREHARQVSVASEHDSARRSAERLMEDRDIGDIACTIGDALKTLMRLGRSEAAGRLMQAAFERQLDLTADHEVYGRDMHDSLESVALQFMLKESLVEKPGAALLTVAPIGGRVQ